MRAALLAVCLLLVAASVAEAGTFRGRSTQERRVLLETNAERRPIEFDIRWAAPCSDRKVFEGATKFTPPYDFRTRTRLRDEGSYTVRLRNGERLRIHAWVRGRRVAPRRWRGRFGGSVVVRRDGRVVGRCKSGIVGWRASR